MPIRKPAHKQPNACQWKNIEDICRGDFEQVPLSAQKARKPSRLEVQAAIDVAAKNHKLYGSSK